MKTRPRLTVCAAITADGKLDPAAATLGDFGPPPDGGAIRLTNREITADLRGLFDDARVDVIRLLVRPKIDGRRAAPTLGGEPGDFFPASIRCRLLSLEVRGDECLLHYRVLRTKAKRALGSGGLQASAQHRGTF